MSRGLDVAPPTVLGDAAALRGVVARNAAIAAAAAPPAPAQLPASHVDAAVVLARRGLHGAASESLRAASGALRRDRSPDRAHARFRLLCAASYLAYAGGRPGPAESRIRCALAQAARLPEPRRGPACGLALANLATLLERTGRSTEALALRERAARESPGRTSIAHLAFALDARGEHARVLAALATLPELAAPAGSGDAGRAAEELLRAVALHRTGDAAAAALALARYDAIARARGFERVALERRPATTATCG